MKTTSLCIALLIAATASHAAILYYQDFSDSQPVTDQAGNNPIVDDTRITTLLTGEVIRGGDAGELAANGAYTLTIDSAGDYYIFNETADPGFKAIDTKYRFESARISFVDGGMTYTGTIELYGKCNTGGEFFSLNAVALVQEEATGEVYVEVDFNYYADTQEGGSDSLLLTLDFGINDSSELELEELIGVELGGNTTGAGVYRHELIVPLEPAYLEAEDMTLDGFSMESQIVASGGAGGRSG